VDVICDVSEWFRTKADTPPLYPKGNQTNAEILQAFCNSLYNSAILHKSYYNAL